MSLLGPGGLPAVPLSVTPLQGTFEVTSALLRRRRNQDQALDQPSPGVNRAHTGGGTVATQGWAYRVLAKRGTWKIAKVDGFGHGRYGMSSWIAYHSSYASPVELLSLARDTNYRTRMNNPRVAWVNRYDWGGLAADDVGLAKVLGELEGPGSSWTGVHKRTKRLHDEGDYLDLEDDHPDNEYWRRLASYAAYNSFLVDAPHAVSLLKTVARPSMLDHNLATGRGSTLYAGERPVGCNIVLDGAEHEYARMIFSEEDCTAVPGKKELIGFWHDMQNEYYDDDYINLKLATPRYADVHHAIVSDSLLLLDSSDDERSQRTMDGVKALFGRPGRSPFGFYAQADSDPGHEDRDAAARLVFSEEDSATGTGVVPVPGKKLKELVAFWYEPYYEDEYNHLGAGVPTYEDVV
ncbi:hypothetical protein HMN09_00782200 [Mycena chlorophos]|uniref:Uncharacterized protein n=1 Tax=Mycena chlorophos TaxID=658473 RepID=A0A8H6SV89_MYCCL|nr:hypothetical protein HMN09_00782200 [Mycena chlorophos]